MKLTNLVHFDLSGSNKKFTIDAPVISIYDDENMVLQNSKERVQAFVATLKPTSNRSIK